MNVLGRRSLSSFYKLLLDVAFYGVCLAVLLSVAVTVFALSGGTNISLSLPVRFEIAPSAYQLQRTGGAVLDAAVDDASGDLTIEQPPAISVAVTMLAVIGVEMAILLVLYRLRRIFRRLVEGRPFQRENARDLRFIGLAIVVSELAFALLQYLGQRGIASSLSSAQLSFQAVFAPNLAVILAGFALLIVAEVFREGTKMRADLETAREIQTSLVAPPISHYGATSIHARMQPAAEVGGDYYDVIELGDGRLAFMVADVAGKGLPAALLMTLLRGSVRSLISAGLRGSALMTALNTHLVANTPGNRMVTCFYGELDLRSGQLLYVNAGHNPPCLYDDNGMRPLDPTAIVLGMIDGMPFAEASAELSAGSRLLLYTDGITEAENTSGDQFGVERLESDLTAHGHLHAADVLDPIIASVVRFRGRARQSDDMTMMLVCREALSATLS